MRKTLFLIFSALTIVTASAQVTVEAKLDSMSRLVGEQARLTLEVTAPTGKTVKLPEINVGQMLVGDVEVVTVSGVDTLPLNDGKQMQLTQTFDITSFCDHDTIYQLPALAVQVEGQLHETKPLAIKVFTLDVDTLHKEQFFPPKEIERPWLTWDDIKMLVYTYWGFIALLVVMLFLLYRYRAGKPILSLNIRREKKLPPHQVAMEEINKIKSERKWAEDDSKEYYTRLTDALRRYMTERHGFNAMEMTSDEIIENLLQLDDVMLDELRQLFTTADLVKFAKASTLIGENDLNLVNAIAYIQQTKIEEDENAKPEPEPISEEQKQYKVQRRIMVGVIVVSIATAAGLLVWMGYRLWELFS